MPVRAQLRHAPLNRVAHRSSASRRGTELPRVSAGREFEVEDAPVRVPCEPFLGTCLHRSEATGVDTARTHHDFADTPDEPEPFVAVIMAVQDEVDVRGVSHVPPRLDLRLVPMLPGRVAGVVEVEQFTAVPVVGEQAAERGGLRSTVLHRVHRDQEPVPDDELNGSAGLNTEVTLVSAAPAVCQSWLPGDGSVMFLKRPHVGS